MSFQLPITDANRKSAIESENALSSAPLWWTAPIMGNWRRVANCGDPNARVVDRPNRRLPATAGTFHAHFALLHARFHRPASRLKRGLLRGEGRPFARSAKAAPARRRLCAPIAFVIC